MSRTKARSVFFTAVTAWMMVHVMTLYNTVLGMGSFTNPTFWIVFKNMWVEYVLIFLAAFFVSGPISGKFAFRVVRPTDRPIFIIFFIQIFTVVCQVTLASILGVWHAFGFTLNFLPDYLTCWCRDFVMALPLQLILVGPAARKIFRTVFARSLAGDRTDGEKVKAVEEA